jgi:hypothetical protein
MQQMTREGVQREAEHGKGRTGHFESQRLQGVLNKVLQVLRG